VPPKKTKLIREDWATSNLHTKDIIQDLDFWSGLVKILPTTAESTHHGSKQSKYTSGSVSAIPFLDA
jgi:hypothetical protein